MEQDKNMDNESLGIGEMLSRQTVTGMMGGDKAPTTSDPIGADGPVIPEDMSWD
jgi:hypothetical protein